MKYIKVTDKHNGAQARIPLNVEFWLFYEAWMDLAMIDILIEAGVQPSCIVLRGEKEGRHSKGAVFLHGGVAVNFASIPESHVLFNSVEVPSEYLYQIPPGRGLSGYIDANNLPTAKDLYPFGDPDSVEISMTTHGLPKKLPYSEVNAILRKDYGVI